MQFVEIDIAWKGGRSRKVLAFKHGVGRLAMLDYVKELAEKCGWYNVRMAMGRDRTGWLLGGKK